MRVALACGLLLVMTGNIVVTIRVWRSQLYERGQKIIQTALIWLLPGAAIAIELVMRDGSRSASPDWSRDNAAATNYGDAANTYNAETFSR